MATPLGMTFDATVVEPKAGAPPPVPTDWYNVMITDSEMRENNAKTGAYLLLTLKIMDGPMANRLGWARLNLYNPNPIAVEIAQGELSAICHATKVYQVSDASVLHGRPLMARFVETPAKDGYEAGNDIKGYAAIGEKPSNNAAGMGAPSMTAASPGFATPAITAASAPADTPPWAVAPATAAPPAFAPPAPVAPVAPTTPAPAAPTFTPPVTNAPTVEVTAPAPVPPPVAPAAAAPAAAGTEVPPWLRNQ